MANYESVMVEPPALSGGIFYFPLVLAIVITAGAWLIGGTMVDGGAAILMILTTALAIFIFRRAAAVDPDGGFLFPMLLLSWGAKLAGMGFKLYILGALYGGNADAVAYHREGAIIAEQIITGTLPIWQDWWGTEFVELCAGLLYLFTGPTMVGGWIVWSFLGTIGTLVYYKAFVTAVPAGSRRWYMLLIFLAPSILIWTDSLGKDALMAFFISFIAYGTALIYRRGLRFNTIAWTLFGLGGTLAVRPHLAAIASVALFTAVMIRPIRAGALTPVIRLATIVVFAGLGFLVVRSAATFVDLEDLSVEGVSEFLATEETQSESGGSAFEGGFPTTPQAFGLAVLTVLFRPFPWEASNFLAMASAMEGFMVLLLFFYRFRSVFRAWGSVRRNPYVAFTVVYALLFIFFFSTISNFGILVRQRVQLLPFIFVWLAFQGSARDQEMAAAA